MPAICNPEQGALLAIEQFTFFNAIFVGCVVYMCSVYFMLVVCTCTRVRVYMTPQVHVFVYLKWQYGTQNMK